MCLELQQRRTFAVEKSTEAPYQELTMDKVERLLASLHHCAAGRAGLLTARPHPSWQPRLSPSGVCPLRASPGSVCVWGGTAPWGWISSGWRRAGGCGLQQPPGQALPQNMRKKGFIKHSLPSFSPRESRQTTGRVMVGVPWRTPGAEEHRELWLERPRRKRK